MALAKNVCGNDRAIRIVVGIVLAAFALLSDVDTTWKITAGIVAAIALITAAVKFCPLNSLLHINTCRR